MKAEVVLPLLTAVGGIIWLILEERERRERERERLAYQQWVFKDEYPYGLFVALNYDGVDYFSQLPDDVLTSILSLLNARDATRTSVLSRRWRYLYLSMDTLDFHCLNMFEVECHNHSSSRYYQKKLFRGVTKLLERYSGRKMTRVSVTLCFARKFFSEFDKWMHSIASINVEELSFNFFVCPDTRLPLGLVPELTDELFIFPLELLSQASSLKHLSLWGCIVQPSSKVSFHSLRSLVLQFVLLASGELQSILSSCLNLYSLSISYSRLPSKLCISGAVRCLGLYYCRGAEEIELLAANLIKFESSRCWVARISFSFVPMLKHVVVDISGTFSKPKIFSGDLPDKVISLLLKLWRHEVEYFPTELNMCIFRKIRFLDLILGHGSVFNVAKASSLLCDFPLLRYLRIVSASSSTRRAYKKNLISPIYHTHLKGVEFNGFEGSREEIDIALYILRSTLVLEKMTLARFREGDFIRPKHPPGPLAQGVRDKIHQQLQGQALSRDVVLVIQ